MMTMHRDKKGNWNLFNTNVHGVPVLRSKTEYPYSYDPYLIPRNSQNQPDMTGSYSDRMYQWDYELYHSLKKELVPSTRGDYWNTANPEEVEAFLRKYFNSPDLKFIAMEEGANYANGFPYWIFYYVK